MKWAEASFGIPGLNNIKAGIEAFKTGVDTYNTANAIRSVLEASAALRVFGDAKASLINAALDKARSKFIDWADPAAEVSGYILDVPLVNPTKERPSPPEIPLNALEHLAVAANIRYPGIEAQGTGGNYGLYATIVASLYDEGDSSRPILTPDLKAGALIVVYGAKTYLPALNLALSLSELFQGVFTLPPDAGGSPIPQNVKARVIAAQSLSRAVDRPIVQLGPRVSGGGPYSVRVSWDSSPVLRRVPKSTILYGLKAYHVYVKPLSPIEAGEDLKTHERLVVEIPSMDRAVEGVYLQGVFTDAIISGMDPDVTYYVSVAYTLKVIDESTQEHIIQDPSFSRLSEQVRVRLREQVPSTKFVTGTPPDWKDFRSPIAVIPTLKKEFDHVLGLFDVIRHNLTGYSNDLTGALRYAERQGDKLAADLDRIASLLKRVADQVDKILSASDRRAGVWVTTFRSEGGRVEFVKKLADALLDSDPEKDNAPPFKTGSEPAGALVFVVEGKSPGDIDAMLGPLQAIFTLGGLGSAANVISSLTDTASAARVVREDPSDSKVNLHNLGIDDDPC